MPIASFYKYSNEARMATGARFVLALFGMTLFEDQIPAKRHRLPHVDLYDVSGDELENLERLGTSVGTDLQFCTFWLPIGVSAMLTLIGEAYGSVPISNPHVYETYLVAMFVGYGFGIFFGVRWWLTRAHFKKCVDKIRQRQVGPVGEEGKELKPSELESLPSATPAEGSGSQGQK